MGENTGCNILKPLFKFRLGFRGAVSEVSRGEPYVFGIRRVSRRKIDRVLIENQL